MRAAGDPIHPAHPAALDKAAKSGDSLVERPFAAPWLQWRHPFVFEWNVARLPFPSIHPDLVGLRIVQITDLHLRSHWSSTYDELIRRLDRESPDLILVTGDLVDDKKDPRPALPHLYRILKHLRAPLGCYGILGNHDTLALAPRLRGTNVRLIENARELVRVGGATIELIGLPGSHRTMLSPEFVASVPARDATPPGTLRVVLSHFPDHLRRAETLRPDLFLAGHTHGGQVCLPGMVPIIKHDSLPRRLCSGVHRVGATWLVVCRGLGTTGFPLRLFCPPEVMEIKLGMGKDDR